MLQRCEISKSVVTTTEVVLDTTHLAVATPKAAYKYSPLPSDAAAVGLASTCAGSCNLTDCNLCSWE